MRTFIESLKRLYDDGKGIVVTKEKLETMLAEKKITQEEFDYIIS